MAVVHQSIDEQENDRSIGYIGSYCIGLVITGKSPLRAMVPVRVCCCSESSGDRGGCCFD
jgi:hypothetical protein